MILRRCIFIIVFFSSFTYAYTYSDYDVDGVDDSIDTCPNTPFELTVDENGCEEGRQYQGSLTLLAGTVASIDANSDTLTNFLLYVNYQYYDWDISFSTFKDIKNTTDVMPNTLYITTGYQWKVNDTLQMKVSLGTKQSDIQDDYYVSTYVDYSLNQNQNLFLYYSYTYAEDESVQEYDNFSTFSLGSGRIFTDYWYSAISYDFSEATLKNREAYKALSWTNTFALTSKYYVLTNYSYGLSDAASDHTISIQFGVKFE
jgi:hypothetical protein